MGILQAFTAERPSLKLTEIARITHMNATAAQRFTDTLLQLGFLHRSPQRDFMLGPKVLTLGLAFLNGSHLKRLAEIHIAEFAEKYRYTVNMGVLDGDEVVFLYRHEARRFLKYDLKAGSRLPSHCTATGKVLLAALPDKRLKGLLEHMNMEALTRYTITTPEGLRDHLIKTRRRGHSVSDREMSLALYAVGVPVLSQERQVVAAVNVSLSADAPQPKRAKALAELIALGRTLSQSMGYEGQYPLIPVTGADGSEA